MSHTIKQGFKMKKTIKQTLSCIFIATLAFSTISFADEKTPKKEKEMAEKVATAPTSLIKNDVKVGEGAEAKSGHLVSVHYTGWLYDPKAADFHGKEFDSSRKRNKAFKFPLGAGRVIKGWDKGVEGMKVGGQRTLVIPSDLGYGARGAGGVIPPNAVLVFDVELMGVE